MKSDNMFLYPNKISVNGFCRSVISDLISGNINFIPNDLYNLINNNHKEQIIDDIPDEYAEFLIKNKITYNSNKSLFSELSKEWNSPNLITNTIIHLNESNIQNISKYADIFDDILCKNLQLQVESNITDIQLKKFLRKFNESYLSYIEIVFYKRKTKLNKDILIEFCENNSRIFRFVIENSSDSVEFLDSKKSISVTYNKFKPTFIHVQNPNISIYTESQKHHTYFNRKLYIGEKGEIKNAPECKEEFGFIQDIKDSEELKTIITKPKFQKYWFVHKELCDVCKDCEFRYMCVDSRLPYQRKNGSWHHKQECNYNPYISKWQGEEGYKTLKECGVVCNEKGYTIDEKKIAKINEEIWG
jgi:SPASM domain peptide maturase of grasp-with-spasm system